MSSFHLPGEGQKIDRIMENFAQGYCASNPTIFSNPGVLYVRHFVYVRVCVRMYHLSSHLYIIILYTHGTGYKEYHCIMPSVTIPQNMTAF